MMKGERYSCTRDAGLSVRGVHDAEQLFDAGVDAPSIGVPLELGARLEGVPHAVRDAVDEPARLAREAHAVAGHGSTFGAAARRRGGGRWWLGPSGLALHGSSATVKGAVPFRVHTHSDLCSA